MTRLLLVITLCISAFQVRAQQPQRSPLPPKTILTDSSQQIADRIIKSKIPVLVDFYAVWCKPCKLLDSLVLKKLERTYHGRVLFLKVNVDVHHALAAYFRIQPIPAVFLINNSAVVKAYIGLHPKEDYTAGIDSVLAVSGPALKKEAPHDSTSSMVQ